MRFVVSVLVLLVLVHYCSSTLNIVKDILQYNIAGHPVLHKELDYPFDPDVGPRQARLYQQTNGVYGEKAIERLGLGIDGRHQERLLQQQIRDVGYLGHN
ncbi:hypothetical protein RN001_000592 [Aquatica leii]|uniref:Secreted protein n=1 Tax=Aquatica leii TaxID=1421715 RepID=A0AAN7PKB9_9COLE|nr:hypothetical protein RN001_000592 [Aquatica leii]